MQHFLRWLALASLFQIISALNATDYKITSLLGIDVDRLNFTQYSGHIELNKTTNSNMFFWMLEKEIKAGPEQLIIWLNGGPGCSSMDGLFLEMGPYRVNKDLTLSFNEHGWQKYATMLYVDQPVGTGFSFANTNSYMHNISQVTDSFVSFLDEFYNIFPHIQEYDFYLAGESYAGVYIPYFATKILEMNKKKGTKYRLKGVLIGNGWISPEHQYNSMYDFVEMKNLLDATQLKTMSEQVQTCKEALRKKEEIHIGVCEQLTTFVLEKSVNYNEKGDKMCLNMYDIRLTNEPYPDCGYSWPHFLEDVTRYLRLDQVKSAIHAEKQELGWKECSSLVHLALHGDKTRPPYYLLPDILKEIPVLLYSGEHDLICNSLGTQYLIGNMTWGGSKGFSEYTKQEEWKINEELAGYYMQERNLSFVFIKDGSHMVPHDRPLQSLDMMSRFIRTGNTDISGRNVLRQPLQEEPAAIDNAFSNHWGAVSIVIVCVFALIGAGCWYHQSSFSTKQRGRTRLDDEPLPLDDLQPDLFEAVPSDSESEVDYESNRHVNQQEEIPLTTKHTK